MEVIKKEDAIEALVDITTFGAVEDIYNVSQDWVGMSSWIGGVNDSIEALDNAEQMEIIECKDCRFYGCQRQKGTQFEKGTCFGWHDELSFQVSPYDFCFRGEKA